MAALIALALGLSLGPSDAQETQKEPKKGEAKLKLPKKDDPDCAKEATQQQLSRLSGKLKEFQKKYGGVLQAQTAKEAQGNKDAAKGKQAEDSKDKKDKKDAKEEPKPKRAGS